MDPNIARILLEKKETDRNPGKAALPAFQFEPSVMVDLFPGPAALVDGQIKVIHHNVFANSLLNPLRARQAFLTAMISRCLANLCPDSQKTTLQDEDGSLRHYDLFAFPVQQGQAAPVVFLFGRETTIEHNLTHALVDSRQMFKDLVNCSTDFAWETDRQGKFIYASPKGILGYSAYELNGKNSGDLIIGDSGDSPFNTRHKVDEAELWLSRADGTLACLLISAVPLLDNQAEWQGVRGVCRDITAIREKEALLRRTRKREHILDKIVSSIRDMITPSDMLANALSATLEGIPAQSGFILQKNQQPDGSFKAEVKQHHGLKADADLVHRLCQKAMTQWEKAGEYTPVVDTFAAGPQQILMSMTSHHGGCNGAIFLIRNKAGADIWTTDENHLFGGIATHLGIALEQVITHEELERRAFTDELTNLLNRRAFTRDVTKRIAHQKRSLKQGAMLYLDLDNFKNVNDRKGHAHGDMILQQLAHFIQDNIRVGDYAARLGGDEFAIWLDDVNSGNAQNIARKFIATGPRLSHMAHVEGPELSLSIGIAMSRPDMEQTFDALLAQADTALYQAKSAGKATCILYDPNNETTATGAEEDNNA